MTCTLDSSVFISKPSLEKKHAVVLVPSFHDRYLLHVFAYRLWSKFKLLALILCVTCVKTEFVFLHKMFGFFQTIPRATCCVRDFQLHALSCKVKFIWPFSEKHIYDILIQTSICLLASGFSLQFYCHIVDKGCDHAVCWKALREALWVVLHFVENGMNSAGHTFQVLHDEKGFARTFNSTSNHEVHVHEQL